MKKKLLCLLMLVCFLCTGCNQPQKPQEPSSTAEDSVPLEPSYATDPASEATEPPVSPLLEDYLTESALLEAPVRKYGESISHMQMEEDFVARILYPSGDLESLDTAVENWVQQTAAYYQTESVGSSADGDSAELTVDYSSYLIQDAFVSVKLLGIYDRPYLAHPIDVSASFNASKATGKLLTIEDVLLPGGKEALLDMVITDADVKSESIDENLLNHWLLTPEGLEITLVRGDYLPMSDGTVTLFYSYETLDDILSLSGSTPQDAPVSDAPQPIPVPETANPSSAVDPSKPMLALTFDDGPSAHTERLLDAFAAYGGKGTFYVVGNMLDGRPDTLRRMAAEGHEIGGHSWNHRQLTKLGTEELTDQLMSTRAKIYEITGTDATTMRPPYGSCNDQVKANAGELGIALINWSVDTLDWKYKNADTVYQAVMDGAKDGAIILSHDLHKTTVDAMEQAIPALIAEGYQLVTVTELLTSDGGTINAGKLYYNR